MRNPFRGKLFIFFLVFYYCCPSYGQLIISLPLNEQSEKDCRDLQFYLISSDTTRMVEIPIGSEGFDYSETLLNKLEDSIWMAIIRYKEDYYMLGFINDKDYTLTDDELKQRAFLEMTSNYNAFYNEFVNMVKVKYD